MNSAIIFGLLIALMLTGMPISIALGLTVLSFLFVMTSVPIEAVALKLFTGIESFEIMAIPFFILAGNFLTHGGVARRMIAFGSSMVGHWYGGLGLAAVVACALFAAISGSSPATVVAIGSIILPAMVKHGYPKRFGAGVIATSGALGILIPPSIVMVLVRGGHRRQRGDRSRRQARPLGLGRAAVHGRRRSGLDPGHYARHDHVLPRVEERLSAHAKGELAGGGARVPRFGVGLAANLHRTRRHLYRRLHPDRSRRHERGLCLCGGGIRLSRHETQRCAEGIARLGQYERDDPLHHHQRGAVLVPDDQRTDSAGDDGVDQG